MLHLEKVRLVCLDLNGTLFERVRGPAEQEWAREYGLDQDAVYEAIKERQSVIERPWDPWGDVIAIMASCGERIDRLEARRRLDRLGQLTARHMHEYPGALDMIRQLQEHYWVILLTGAGFQVAASLHYLNLPPMEVVITAQEGFDKDQSELYRLVEARYEVEPHEILLVDDVPSYVLKAEDCGWQGIVVRHPAPGDPDSLSRKKRIPAPELPGIERIADLADRLVMARVA